jgi:hypothetical protein
VSARIWPGIEAVLLDLSDGGARLETAYRLLPGHRIELRLHDIVAVTEVRGDVLRCRVAGLSADRVTYEGAVAFDRPVPWVEPDRRPASCPEPDGSGGNAWERTTPDDGRAARDRAAIARKV